MDRDERITRPSWLHFAGFDQTEDPQLSDQYLSREEIKQPGRALTRSLSEAVNTQAHVLNSWELDTNVSDHSSDESLSVPASGRHNLQSLPSDPGRATCDIHDASCSQHKIGELSIGVRPGDTDSSSSARGQVLTLQTNQGQNIPAEWPLLVAICKHLELPAPREYYSQRGILRDFRIDIVVRVGDRQYTAEARTAESARQLAIAEAITAECLLGQLDAESVEAVRCSLFVDEIRPCADVSIGIGAQFSECLSDKASILCDAEVVQPSDIDLSPGRADHLATRFEQLLTDFDDLMLSGPNEETVLSVERNAILGVSTRERSIVCSETLASAPWSVFNIHEKTRVCGSSAGSHTTQRYSAQNRSTSSRKRRRIGSGAPDDNDSTRETASEKADDGGSQLDPDERNESNDFRLPCMYYKSKPGLFIGKLDRKYNMCKSRFNDMYHLAKHYEHVHFMRVDFPLGVRASLYPDDHNHDDWYMFRKHSTRSPACSTFVRLTEREHIVDEAKKRRVRVEGYLGTNSSAQYQIKAWWLLWFDNMAECHPIPMQTHEMDHPDRADFKTGSLIMNASNTTRAEHEHEHGELSISSARLIAPKRQQTSVSRVPNVEIPHGNMEQSSALFSVDLHYPQTGSSMTTTSHTETASKSHGTDSTHSSFVPLPDCYPATFEKSSDQTDALPQPGSNNPGPSDDYYTSGFQQYVDDVLAALMLATPQLP